MHGLLMNEFLIKLTHWAVVVSQLIERSLLTPEIHGPNPNIGNKIFRKQLSVNCCPEKMKINKKRPGMAHLKKSSPKATKLANVIILFSNIFILGLSREIFLH